jgi:hypothetical protein
MKINAVFVVGAFMCALSLGFAMGMSFGALPMLPMTRYLTLTVIFAFAVVWGFVALVWGVDR